MTGGPASSDTEEGHPPGTPEAALVAGGLPVVRGSCGPQGTVRRAGPGHLPPVWPLLCPPASPGRPLVTIRYEAGLPPPWAEALRGWQVAGSPGLAAGGAWGPPGCVPRTCPSGRAGWGQLGHEGGGEVTPWNTGLGLWRNRPLEGAPDSLPAAPGGQTARSPGRPAPGPHWTPQASHGAPTLSLGPERGARPSHRAS